MTRHCLDLGIDFNSLRGLRFVFLKRRNELVILPEEVCFYEAAFLCRLRFPVHPFIIELLNRFGIALGQLMPNSWKIMVSCMEI